MAHIRGDELITEVRALGSFTVADRFGNQISEESYFFEDATADEDNKVATFYGATSRGLGVKVEITYHLLEEN